MSGKGWTPRPFSVAREVYESNHEAIFGKRERRQYVPPVLPGKEQQQAVMDEKGDLQ
jgi:hypothetical protein